MSTGHAAPGTGRTAQVDRYIQNTTPHELLGFDVAPMGISSTPFGHKRLESKKALLETGVAFQQAVRGPYRNEAG